MHVVTHTAAGSRLLVSHPDPDFGRIEKLVRRSGLPDRVPFIELFADRPVMEACLGEALPEEIGAPPTAETRAAWEKGWQQVIHFWYGMGYDYMTSVCAFSLQSDRHAVEDTADLSKGKRVWVNEDRGMIGSWADFEAYPWPRHQDIDFSNVEYAAANLPDGMKVIFLGPGGQMENMTWLMGLTNLAVSTIDNPDLVQAVAQKVGELLVYIFSTVADIPNVGALWLGDDMGFKSGTFISPRSLRRFVFPWQKRLAGIAHDHGLPFLLHSCGNLRSIMDDLIDDVCIDAKHSFEDVIMPVTEAKRLWGHRVALLGGIDVDFLCNADETGVRRRVREVIDACAPGGGWGLGTGNSVANYIPLQNYIAMLDEGRKYGRYS